MSDHAHSKASAVRAPVASPSTPALSLSPIVQLQPTGYRDIQPFQRGQGWHSNGKATAKLRRAREASERVVFPVIPTHHTGVGTATSASSSTSAGPSASAVDRYDSSAGAIEDTDDSREREEAEIKRAMSPSIAAIPVPPPQRPQRPSSGSQAEGNQRSSSSGSFRTRALVSASTSAVQSNTKSGAAATATNLSRRSADGTDDNDAGDQDDELPPPDPATMEKLWREYNERTRHPTKTVDHESYHRKMQHRYNEAKALRERIARLEMELDDTRQERDEALETAQQHEQRLRRASLARKSVKDTDDLELNHTTSSADFVAVDASLDESGSATRSGIPDRNLAAVAARVSNKLHTQQRNAPTVVVNPEEVSYREKCFKLERTLAAAKEGLAQMQAKLLAMHETDRETIETLRAQLQLEQQASKLLAVQVRETDAAFRSTANELVTTQVALEKVEIEKQIVVEQIQAETKQLLSDHKRKELQSRVKSVVRTLGKEALHQKMEALHTRVLTAEHHMRAAQLEATRLQSERDQQQQQLDAILSSRAIKYHGLASSDGGIPGILQRATSLYHGTRTINGQFLMVQMLYEDTRGTVEAPFHRSNQDDETSRELDDGYAIHILVYEAFTAQDDYLTFHLRDIHRLVPDADKYLARFKDRRHDRFLELAELLLQQCHIGYKNGHIVLTEMATDRIAMGESERREIPIYRGTRYLRSQAPEDEDGPTDDELLVDLVVSEVYNPSVSQLWWLEIQAMRVDQDPGSDENQCAAHESRLTIDNQQLKEVIATFASYRPSESMQISHETMDTQSAFSIHEDLLEPLFERMEWRHTSTSTASSSNSGTGTGSSCLVLVGKDGSAIASSKDGAVEEIQSSDLESGDSTQEKTEDAVQSDCDWNQEADFNSKAGTTAVAGTASTQRVLDHRSVVRHGDLFYCVRIQEIWDGELMLRITMEEPEDDTRRYEAALLEKDIASIAEFLYRSGGCSDNHAASIKYGLPASLHDPMCKLLKKHARPNSSVSREGKDQPTTTASVERISMDSLLHEIYPPPEARRQQYEVASRQSTESVQVQMIQLPSAIMIGHRLVDHVRLVGMANDKTDAQFIQDVLTQFQTLREDGVATKQRIGCRGNGESSSSSFVVATGYYGFEAPFNDIVVIDVCSVVVDQHPSSSKQATSELVISRVSMRLALATIGFRVSVSEPPSV